jgi:hypothetical protein
MSVVAINASRIGRWLGIGGQVELQDDSMDLTVMPSNLSLSREGVGV